MRTLLLAFAAMTTLTGCPLAILSTPPPIPPTVTDYYPKVLPPPVLGDYIDPKTHVDIDGLEEYRSALQSYREYIERHERVITRRYNLSEVEKPITVITEPQIKEEERIVYVDRPVPISTPPTLTDTHCPLACPPELKIFTPLFIPTPPIFRPNVDTDKDIIDGLTAYIEDLAARIRQHNEDHNREPQ